jgi:NADPH:quinone reductase-like Zn-dependent oxidoreductase
MKAISLSQDEARRLADQCADLLREQFGVRRVLLFGSAAGDAPWHSRSDLDLAVDGLRPEDHLQGSQRLLRAAATRPGTRPGPAGVGLAGAACSPGGRNKDADRPYRSCAIHAGLAGLVDKGALRVHVDKTFPLEEAGAALQRKFHLPNREFAFRIKS